MPCSPGLRVAAVGSIEMQNLISSVFVFTSPVIFLVVDAKDTLLSCIQRRGALLVG